MKSLILALVAVLLLASSAHATGPIFGFRSRSSFNDGFRAGQHQAFRQQQFNQFHNRNLNQFRQFNNFHNQQFRGSRFGFSFNY